ncbi:MAG: TIGR00282 family metallophosphoesterase [Clostridiales bacterium]|nr:TIGR00282 family metallophosphoesterase [Clostridiales bacterium]
MKVLMIGDVVSRPGRTVLKEQLTSLIEEYQIDFTIVNGENASGGNGITEKNARELFNLPIDVMTMGNHVWQQKEMVHYIEKFPRIIRPLNYPEPCPGKGYDFFEHNGKTICVMNLSGQIFMPELDSPFNLFSRVWPEIEGKFDLLIVDFHAEATGEKKSLAYYLDGRVSAVFGTHTHVQTADECIFEHGTGYISDLGMTGPKRSVLGVKPELVIQKMRSKMPVRFDLADGACEMGCVLFTIDEKTGKTIAVERLKIE